MGMTGIRGLIHNWRCVCSMTRTDHREDTLLHDHTLAEQVFTEFAIDR